MPSCTGAAPARAFSHIQLLQQTPVNVKYACAFSFRPIITRWGMWLTRNIGDSEGSIYRMISVSNLTSLSHSRKSDFSTVFEFGLFKSSHTRQRSPLPSQNREKRPSPSLQRKHSITLTCMPILLDMTALLYPIPSVVQGTSPAFLIVISIGGGRPLSEAVTSLIAVNHLSHCPL
ncbi:hypothetical protein BGW80DRAFT_164565 [Lactifluus volemus]|nr:hypothetical protein BGW80DRAFT_164565 [Lactifluus volemus]